MGRLGDFQKFPNVNHQTKLSKMVLDDKKNINMCLKKKALNLWYLCKPKKKMKSHEKEIYATNPKKNFEGPMFHLRGILDPT